MNKKFHILFSFLIITLLLWIVSCQKSTEIIDKNRIDCTIPSIRDSIAEADRQTIHKYITDSSLTVDSTTSGLYYMIADSGTGIHPNLLSVITVLYKGYFTNGNIFSQTVRSTAVSFPLNQLILGWQYGIPLIKKGGKIKLLIPSRLAYGCNSSGIPANSVVIFDVELIDFQ